MVTRIAPWMMTIVAFVGGILLSHTGRSVPAATAAGPEFARLQALDRLESDVIDLKKLVPEQSTAMLGVAQQFGNLWYAAKHENWPLASFFLEETLEGIEWAVSLKPLQAVEGVGTVNLKGIFESLEEGLFPEVRASIAAKDHPRFVAAYQHTIEGCYACHKAVGKPFLRPMVPSEPATRVLNFDPNARWPQ